MAALFRRSCGVRGRAGLGAGGKWSLWCLARGTWTGNMCGGGCGVESGDKEGVRFGAP